MWAIAKFLHVFASPCTMHGSSVNSAVLHCSWQQCICHSDRHTLSCANAAVLSRVNPAVPASGSTVPRRLGVVARLLSCSLSHAANEFISNMWHRKPSPAHCISAGVTSFFLPAVGLTPFSTGSRVWTLAASCRHPGGCGISGRIQVPPDVSTLAGHEVIDRYNEVGGLIRYNYVSSTWHYRWRGTHCRWEAKRSDYRMKRGWNLHVKKSQVSLTTCQAVVTEMRK